jgi:hypothetical protein
VGIEPAITRTLELPCALNFAQLNEVLQASFGWTDSRLRQFILGGLVVGAPEVIEGGYRAIMSQPTRLCLSALGGHRWRFCRGGGATVSQSRLIFPSGSNRGGLILLAVWVLSPN